MDIRRKAYDKLLQWKHSSDSSKAILIKGARRVGKSYLAEAFAKNEYQTYILIDFASPLKGTKTIFEKYGNRQHLNDFFNQLSVLYAVPLIERRSVFIFDEIQKYPKARELIKYLVADGRYDYIETGSLISIHKNVKDIVIPSEEEELLLHPLDFEEFLAALNDTVTIPFLRDAFQSERPLGNLLRPMMEKLRSYMLVGGMPQAVVEYAQSGNIDRVERVKRGILRLYREDIAKFAEGYVAEARAIFDAIPSQLAHHDKKIKYSSLGEGDRFTSYKDAIHWISDSMVGSLCEGTNQPELFGGFSVQPSKLKCYLGDTGLLLTMAAGTNYLKSDLYKAFMRGSLSINRGMMTENLVAQAISSRDIPLRFYEKNIATETGMKKYEVDFLIVANGKVIPLEVKSGQTQKHPSLDHYCRSFHQQVGKGVILTKGDLRITDTYRYIPLPMTWFLLEE